MVYSTCAMNPVENEAIIAELLRKAKGSVELVDVSDKLPNLLRRPGVTTWKITDGRRWYSDSTDVGNSQTVIETAFPPTLEENKKFQLEKCVRIYPHLQDTGAFFIALLKKNSSITGRFRTGVKTNWFRP
eukprot:TRINITY_DN4928_c0_g1_i1.p1 TRINITY_DN4928_c0_g1~~TRINITY_DN4928_c0_g1_i1.p1  ORF type:complete len:130 (+),score=16.20 TRINITY_DN4928_c0_g1_i1:222-611(+)